MSKKVQPESGNAAKADTTPKEYKFSLTTFSPSGRLIQLEYGLAAADREALTVGIVATNGVVIASENKCAHSSLVDPNCAKRVEIVTGHMGMVFSGLQPDFRLLVAHARKEAQKYMLGFKDKMPVTECVKRVGALMQSYSKNGGVRPFGVLLLVCGWHGNKPYLYSVDPSGLSAAWKATAIGSNCEEAKAFLKKQYYKDIKLNNAVNLAIRCIKTVNKGQKVSIDLGTCDKGGFTRMNPNEVTRKMQYMY